MPKFRKKPVVIEAVQWSGGLVVGGTPAWLAAAIKRDWGSAGAAVRVGDDIRMHTLEGMMIARPGDWIIQGVAGEIYPCKPDIFAATYDPVEA